METPVDLSTIVRSLGDALLAVKGPRDRKISHPAPIHEAKDSDSITFCSREGDAAVDLIAGSRAGIILCLPEVALPDALLAGKTLLLVKNPRLSFLRLLRSHFCDPSPQGIHPSAVVHPKAKVHPTAFIGPLCVVDECEIGEGTILHGSVHLYPKTKVGRRVIIHAGAILGADGFGYQRNEQGDLEKFPHIGGVLIEDDVEIGANTCIDRGALGDTIIRQGAKLDNLVHIAHSVVIGRRSMIIAHAMVAGSTRVGEEAWVAPGACLRDGIQVGDRTLIGMGAVVLKDVPDGQTVLGNPARPVERR